MVFFFLFYDLKITKLTYPTLLHDLIVIHICDVYKKYINPKFEL